MHKIKSLIFQILIFFVPGWNWFIKFRKANKSSLVSAKMTDQFWAFRRGFFLETVKICNINENNFHEYLSDRFYRSLHPINKAYSGIIDNKLYLPFLLRDYQEYVPQYYYFIDKGRLVNLNPDHQILNDSNVTDLIKQNKKLVLKHCFSALGKGYNLLEWDGEKIFLNKTVINYEKLILFVKSLDNYIITEYINQHQYAYEINPGCANTVRLYCVWDYEKNKFFIQSALHKFGMDGNLVDNLGDDGRFLAFIDVTSGRIKSIGLIKKKGKPIRLTNASIHPDSKMPIANVQVPNWDKVIHQALKIMNNLSFLKFVNIDLVITESGFKILEMNSLPKLFIMQVERGLLKDKRLLRFFNEITKIN